MQDYAIRAAGIGDLERLLPLVHAYRVFFEQEPDSQREREFIESHLLGGSSAIFLAETNAHAVAFMQLFRTYSTVHLAPAFVLEISSSHPHIESAVSPAHC